MNQALVAEEQPNVPLGESEKVESEESENDSDRKGSRRRETPIAKLKDEFREMRATMTTLIDQTKSWLRSFETGGARRRTPPSQFI